MYNIIIIYARIVEMREETCREISRLSRVIIIIFFFYEIVAT